MVLVVLRNLSLLGDAHAFAHTNTPVQHELVITLLPALVAATDTLSMTQLHSCVQTLVTFFPSDAARARNVLGPVGLALVFALGRRADELLGAGAQTPEDQARWTSYFEAFVGHALPVLVALASDPVPAEHIWEFINLCGAHCAGLRQELYQGLGLLVRQSEQQTPSMEMFLQIVHPSSM